MIHRSNQHQLVRVLKVNVELFTTKKCTSLQNRVVKVNSNYSVKWNYVTKRFGIFDFAPGNPREFFLVPKKNNKKARYDNIIIIRQDTIVLYKFGLEYAW